MRAAYFAHARLFYGLLAAAAVASVVKDVVINSRPPEPANLTFHVLLFGVSVAQAISRSDLFQKVATSLSLLAFCAYVVLLFDKLPS